MNLTKSALQTASADHQPRYATISKRASHYTKANAAAKHRTNMRPISPEAAPAEHPLAPVVEQYLSYMSESEESATLAAEFQQMWDQAENQAKQLRSQRMFEMVQFLIKSYVTDTGLP